MTHGHPIRERGTPAQPLRVCLDLNIWIADLLATWAGRQGTACQTLVRIVQRGVSALGPIQLVISWGMLERLGDVLRVQFEVADQDVQQLLVVIAQYARFGPEEMDPFLVLGGSMLGPVHDTEDAHVLETALAAGTDVLVTANMKDFRRAHDCEVIVPNEILAFPRPDGGISLVVTPRQMMHWMNRSAITTP